MEPEHSVLLRWLGHDAAVQRSPLPTPDRSRFEVFEVKGDIRE